MTAISVRRSIHGALSLKSIRSRPKPHGPSAASGAERANNLAGLTRSPSARSRGFVERQRLLGAVCRPQAQPTQFAELQRDFFMTHEPQSYR
jgi:hypothetical protein